MNAVETSQPNEQALALQRADAEIRAQANPLLAAAEGIVVTNEQELNDAATFLGQCKSALNSIETQRKQLKEPVLESGRRIDAMAKERSAPLNEAMNSVKAKVLDFKAEQQREADEERARRAAEIAEQQRQEQERVAAQQEQARRTVEQTTRESALAQSEARRAAQAGASDAPAKQRAAARAAEAEENARLEQRVAAEVQPIEVVETPVANPATTVKSDSGAAATVRTTLDFEIVDPSRVPSRFLTVDEKAVRAAINAGEREIPGIQIVEKKSLAVRAA